MYVSQDTIQGKTRKGRSHAIGAAVIRSGIKEIVNRLLDGDRLNLPSKRTMQIKGVSGHEPKGQFNQYGKFFTIKITGIRDAEKVIFGLNSKCKQRLTEKLHTGQWYPGRV